MSVNQGHQTNVLEAEDADEDLVGWSATCECGWRSSSEDHDTREDAIAAAEEHVAAAG